jgi:hypothetical protein
MSTQLVTTGLDSILAGIDAAILAGNQETAKLIANLGQQLAPVDEGDFRDSIGVAPGKDALSARVISDGSKAPHNIYVELGNPDVPAYPAQPTLEPAAAAIDQGVEVAKALRALIGRSAP